MTMIPSFFCMWKILQKKTKKNTMWCTFPIKDLFEKWARSRKLRFRYFASSGGRWANTLHIVAIETAHGTPDFRVSYPRRTILFLQLSQTITDVRALISNHIYFFSVIVNIYQCLNVRGCLLKLAGMSNCVLQNKYQCNYLYYYP